ncbi:hypothetical protein MTR_4g014200 [Medicago truncatula]|uniref:TIR domain-containing protein n=1 Tax=Medicago truncatula TaxID=3880 RepID=G7JKM3_MEDTR|nr:hypothetical protein MTR_4g014200 [Medicago truncatula]
MSHFLLLAPSNKYEVDPADVRYQMKGYENAFVEYQRMYSSTKVHIWRHAFKKSANLSGIKSSDFRGLKQFKAYGCICQHLGS